MATSNELPSLLNSSRRRRKTLDSLFPHLANTVYHCKEFPDGVYINAYGQICPNGPDSDEETGPESDDDDDDDAEEDDDDDDEEEDDEETESEEAGDDDDDDDYVPDEEVDRQVIEDDLRDEAYCDRQDQQNEARRATKKRKRGKVEDEEDRQDARIRRDEAEVIDAHQDALADIDHYNRVMAERNRRTVESSKLVSLVRRWYEEWGATKRKAKSLSTVKTKAALKLAQKAEGAQREQRELYAEMEQAQLAQARDQLRRSQLQLGYESHMSALEEQPRCYFTVARGRDSLMARMDAQRLITCHCGLEVKEIGRLFEHAHAVLDGGQTDHPDSLSQQWRQWEEENKKKHRESAAKRAKTAAGTNENELVDKTV